MAEALTNGTHDIALSAIAGATTATALDANAEAVLFLTLALGQRLEQRGGRGRGRISVEYAQRSLKAAERAVLEHRPQFIVILVDACAEEVHDVRVAEVRQDAQLALHCRWVWCSWVR